MAAKQKNRSADGASTEAKRPAVPEPVTAPRALVSGTAGLKLLVFVAGAVLMGLEIVASRILAPYFGNSVFVWGSLISLFLIALSAGYYIGGRVADRRPSQGLFAAIMMGVAAAMFVVAAIGDPVSSAILAQGFGEKSGPFLASIILFLTPSVGMGMASPFAVRLATHTVASVGKTAGTLYALSTVGSIVGTMLTTFVLIPWIGAGAILKGLATALLLAAVATFPFANRGSGVRGALIALVLAGTGLYFVGASHAALPPGLRNAKLVAEVNTPYHHISVVDHDGQHGRARQLRFDRFTESEIELAPPYRGLTDYTYYFHLAFLPQPKIKRALFIGAGGGVGPRSFHMHDPDMEIDVVDIDGEVLRAAYDYFYLDRTPKITATAADGRSFVRGAAAGSYDCIILDAFTIGGRIPFHLVTREFFELCREKLAPGGVFLMNINSSLSGKNSGIFHSMFNTVESAFPSNAYAFAYGLNMVSPTVSTNIILVGVNSDKPISPSGWSELADRYESASYVNGGRAKRMVADLLAPTPDVSGAALFTDDYAPIETMSF